MELLSLARGIESEPSEDAASLSYESDETSYQAFDL